MSRTRVIAVALLPALLFSIAGCSGEDPTARTSASSDEKMAAWPELDQPFRGKERFSPYTGVTEFKQYTSMEDALHDSTLVLTGEVVDVRNTRVVGELNAGGAQLVGVEVRISKVLHGSLPSLHADRDRLVVEFHGDESNFTAVPEGYGVWFLRWKEDPKGVTRKPDAPADPDESEYYRLISSQGLFVQGQDHVQNPVRERAGDPEATRPGAAPTPGHPDRPDPVSARGESFRKLSEFAAWVDARDA